MVKLIDVMVFVMVWTLCTKATTSKVILEDPQHNRTVRPIWGHGCVLDNMEIKISSKTSQKDLLFGLFRSLKLLLPCFMRTTVIVPDLDFADMKDHFHHNLTERGAYDESDLSLINIISENAPEFILKLGYYYQLQYHDFALDKLNLKNPQRSMS